MIQGYEVNWNKNISSQLNSLWCHYDKETLSYENKDTRHYGMYRRRYTLLNGKFTEEPIEEMKSCNEFVAALKNCIPFQGIYDI